MTKHLDQQPSINFVTGGGEDQNPRNRDPAVHSLRKIRVGTNDEIASGGLFS
jgi:hypothetical protein